MRQDTCPFGVITVHFGDGIVIRLRAGQPSACASIPGREFSERTSGFRTYAAYCVGTGVKRSSPEADRPLPSSGDVNNARKSAPTPLCDFVACTGSCLL
jgi:hypothetical protein